MNAWLPQASYPCGTCTHARCPSVTGYILGTRVGSSHHHLVCEHNRVVGGRRVGCEMIHWLHLTRRVMVKVESALALGLPRNSMVSPCAAAFTVVKKRCTTS